MADPYYIDLERFSLERFRQILDTGDVLPGRRILKEKISQRFAVLESMGIQNLKELTEVLKTKARVERFAQQSGLPNDYLVILRREANSYLPKPVNLRDFPGVDPQHIKRLASAGIKNTKHLFERCRSRGDRALLSGQVDVPSADLLELVKLSDLARVSGVGPVFARIILDAGIDTLEKLANSSAEASFERFVAVNQEKQYTRARFTEKDVQYCIDMANQLPKVVEYG
jgi:hypothetical protein